MLKKLHFCYGRASLLKYHESQIWFWICGDQVFECLGEGTVQVLWLSSLGAFIAGHGRGWINDLLYQCLGSGNAKKQNLNWNATLNWWQGLLNVQKNSRSVEYCHFSEICLASGSDWPILWSLVQSTAVNRPILLLSYLEPHSCTDVAKGTKFCPRKCCSIPPDPPPLRRNSVWTALFFAWGFPKNPNQKKLSTVWFPHYYNLILSQKTRLKKFAT